MKIRKYRGIRWYYHRYSNRSSVARVGRPPSYTGYTIVRGEEIKVCERVLNKKICRALVESHIDAYGVK